MQQYDVNMAIKEIRNKQSFELNDYSNYRIRKKGDIIENF